MKRLIGFSCLTGVLLLACNSVQSDWQKVSSANTVAAYEQFLNQYPNTPQAEAARQHIQSLRDEQTWTETQRQNNLMAFQNYIEQFPAGRHVAEASERISAGERSLAWASASALGTEEALRDFLDKYPKGAEATQARSRLAQISGYRVQLASFKSQQVAEKTRDKLEGRYGDVLGSVAILPDTPSSQHVLRSAPMGEGEANAACARLKRDHLTCAVIKDANS